MPCHRDTMEALARQEGWKRGIEVGLGTGLLFRRFLALGIDMVGVDLGRRPERRAEVETLGGTVHWMASHDAAHHVPDGWADFVFIDAAHSFAAVKDDIARWLAKVRPGGWFGGHDYHPKFPGVIRAVDQAFPGRVLHPHWIWSAC